MQYATNAPPWWLGAASTILCIVLVVGVLWNSVLAVGVVVALLATLALRDGLGLSTSFERVWLKCLGAVLIGYGFLGKGFAYVGIPPLFVGEIILVLGLLAATIGQGIKVAFRSPLSLMWVAFAVLGVARTIPYINVYGLNALRDGVLWGYGVFALLVCALLLRSGWVPRVPEYYVRWLPWFLCWLPVAYLFERLAGNMLPQLPGTDVTLLRLKAGDSAVHLAGVAAFLLLGLHEVIVPQGSSKIAVSVKEWMWWLLWLVATVLVGTSNRGGLLAILIAIGVVLLLRPISLGKWAKVILISSIITAVFFVFNIEIDIGRARKVSPQQIIVNLQSVFGNNDEQYLSGTREWRLEWWSDIVNYTFFGEYFWGGKGFGINLADDDGFQGTAWEGQLRSPHNGHLNVLARAGVPGFMLWLLLQTTFGICQLSFFLHARRSGQERKARISLWILAYWIAFIVNASFDVFLESPQAGIWFWSLFGFGIAFLLHSRADALLIRPTLSQLRSLAPHNHSRG